MKTFRQIADENNLDRTTVFKRTKKISNFKAEHMAKKNGKWFVDDDGVKLLINHRGTRPKKYKSRINTKYDYFKRAKSLADENKWLRRQMTKLIANNTQLTNTNHQLANRPSDNQKALTGQKSKPQPKIEDPWTKKMNKDQRIIRRLTGISNKQDFDNWTKRHKILTWLVKHKK